MTTFVLLLLAALALFGLEMFVPGGVVGALGAVFLFSAVVTAYLNFDRAVAHGVLIAVLMIGTVTLAMWAKYFPTSRLARPFVANGPPGQPDRSYRNYIGAKGVAASDLRPGGSARFGDQRIHVVTRGEYIERGEPIEVVEAAGNRVVVGATGADGA